MEGQWHLKAKKLTETERRWPTHEKKKGHDTLSQDLGHYIGSKDVAVWIYNVTLK
jgi:hypothetical protein